MGRYMILFLAAMLLIPFSIASDYGFNTDTTSNPFGYDSGTINPVSTTTTSASSNNTYNSTYATLLNQNCPSGQVVNGSYLNGTFKCTSVSASGGNSSWNESYANTKYYNISNPRNYLNATTISNTTIVRANSYNCPTGFIVQNLTANSSGVFGRCINQSLVGINYWTKEGTGTYASITPSTLGNVIKYRYTSIGTNNEIIIGSSDYMWTGLVPTRVGIAFNGSNQFNNPPWLPQGFHPTSSGESFGISINSEHTNNNNYSYSGTSLVLDARGSNNGRLHIYTYENVTATKSEPFRIDDFNNLIMQSPDYSNNGDVWIGTNNGNATFHVKSKSVLGCSGTLDCSGYDEGTCDIKTEGCAKTTECSGTHDSCDTFDGGSVSGCTTHDCSYTESCTGSLDCSVYDEGGCNDHGSQCSWDGMTCNNNGACSNQNNEGDCNYYNGCSWFVDCYGDPHTCQQSECDSSAFGCSNSFLSCDNTATCSDILYANCNDYQGCNQTTINPNLATEINAVGFGQTNDAYQCLDSSGVKQTYFDYNCAMTTLQTINVDDVIKLSVITLPTCNSATNGSIGRNQTKIYFCDGSNWNGLY